ncbi:MAG: NlpC/P60 family protein [Thermoleophilia bacterium]|nr:NlpC/P60 family protein [Thermoleophilia bacterium]
MAPTAVAEPAAITDAKKDAAALREQLERFNGELESIIENYNEAQVDLESVQAAIEDNQAKLDRAEQDLDVANTRLESRIDGIYRNGRLGLIEAIFEAESFSDLINRLSLLTRVGATDKDVLDKVAQFRQDVTTRKADLAQQEATVKELLRKSKAAKATIEKKLAERTKMLKGKEQLIAQLEKEEQERQARLEAEAREAARRAREAAATAAKVKASTSPKGSSTPARDVPRSKVGGSVVDVAMQYLGVPYVWGGASPSGFDCSGLVLYAYAKVGVSLPHSSRAQYGYGVPVSRDELQPGDLVFFGSPIHHVGIYVGNGNMIDAPYTGANVRISSISRSHYTGARRIL